MHWTTKSAPVSRRGFMTDRRRHGGLYVWPPAPLRAGRLNTSPDGLTPVDVKEVSEWLDSLLFARPNDVANPPVVLVSMESSWAARIHPGLTRRLAKLVALARRADY